MSTLKVLGIYRHRLTIDGEGVTTLIGLSGCPFKCKYCLNKEILSLGKSKDIEVNKLIQHVMQDYCYFIGTGGGVTFGGGEPLLQYESIKEFMIKAKDLFSVNLETTLNIKVNMDELLDNVTQLIIDIKDINTQIYKEYTGLNNSQLLQNLDIIRQREQQYKCKIRVPMIPKFTTTESINESIKYIRNLGFTNIDQFEYIVKL